MQVQPGDVLVERYRVVRYIASGGMGSVWEAVDTLLAQPVALKHVTFAGQASATADKSRRRTLREARNAARLRGQSGTIAIYDVLDLDDGVWLVMEYLPSSSLGEIMERRPLTVAEVARIGADVATALAAAHRCGVVHRDVKPGNVLIADDGRVKLTDFGIAHAEGDSRVTGTGQLTGTPTYMAREVAAGEASTPASDVYSLASTLYHAVEGVPPFAGDGNLYRMLVQVATSAPRPPQRAGDLAPLLRQMFHPDPACRPSADAVAGLLRELVVGSPGPQEPGRTGRAGVPTARPAVATRSGPATGHGAAAVDVAAPSGSGRVGGGPARVGSAGPDRPAIGWTEIGVGAVAYLVLATLVYVAFFRLPGGTGPPVAAGVVLLALAMLLAALAALAVRVRRWSALGLRPTTWGWITLAVGAGIVLQALAAGIVLAVRGPGALAGDQQADVVRAVGDSAWSVIGVVVVVGLLTSFAEELLLRGIVYGGLRRYGVPAAVVISSVVYGLLNGLTVVLPAILLVGVVNALLYERSGSIWPAVAGHASFNAGAFALILVVM